MLKSGFVILPERDLLPDYKISPFSNIDLAKNRILPDSILIDEYLQDRFKHKRIQYTKNGRAAINIVLRHYNLSSEDCITIFTTTGNLYISSCVTKEIEKFCRWSRKLEKKTKLILVNHEFGYPFEGLKELKRHNIPIIEDCAHSFFSKDESSLIGCFGDYSIYSFPKMFPIQIGGLLVSNIEQNENNRGIKNDVTKEEVRYIKNILSYYIKGSKEMIRSRLDNYIRLRDLLRPLNLSERFELKDGIVPGVFMFKTSCKSDLLPKLKKFMYLNGIQCSVFYGENSFFIPVHQNLVENDIVYFKEVIEEFFDK